MAQSVTFSASGVHHYHGPDLKKGFAVITIAIEIPVLSLERAKAFYETVFEHDPTEILNAGTRRVTLIPGTPLVILNETAGFLPSADGSLPYFEIHDGMSDVLERVTSAGGHVIHNVTSRGGGDVVVVSDSEGNALTIKAVAAA